jgi:hypothetical protein
LNPSKEPTRKPWGPTVVLALIRPSEVRCTTLPRYGSQ